MRLPYWFFVMTAIVNALGLIGIIVAIINKL